MKQTHPEDDRPRESREGKRGQGPGRRTWPKPGNGPRVGRIRGDIPRAQKVEDGDAPLGGRAYDAQGPAGQTAQRKSRGQGGSAPDGRRPSGPVHHGAAWRSASGPKYRDEPADTLPNGAEAIEDAERLLVGRNPIREALRAGRPVEKLLVASGDLSGAAHEIIRLARDAGAVVQQVERSRLDAIAPAHQGMLAYVAAVPYVGIGDMLAAAREKGEDPFIIVLDGITDPHNLGAIIRTAECAGAHGVVIPQRRAAGLTPAAAKAAAGALNYMPVARVANLNRAIDELKEAGVWVLGAAMSGEDAFSADLGGPVALVIGAEGDGISRLTLEKCDRVVSLPMRGHIDSLNASVAAGILMYGIARARAK